MTIFATLAQAVLDETFADSPVFATHLGANGYDDLLDDLSEVAMERRVDRTRHWLEVFTSNAREEPLGLDDDVDRGLLVATLRGRLILADWEMWRRQPDTYLNPGLGGVFALFLHRLKPEPELARAAAARLRQLPTSLADGQRNIRADLAPREYVERAIGQARAGARYVRDLLPAEIGDERARAEVAEAGAVAGKALEQFAAFLEGLREQATGAWAIGEERYSRLLREKELLGVGARELRQRGHEAYDGLAADLRRVAQVVAGTDDWPTVLRHLNDDHPATPEAMRQAYADWTEKARAFVRDRGLVTLPPGEECTVEPSPPFQRPVLGVASYQAPPAFSDAMRGHFFVPFPPDGASQDEVQQRLAGNSYPSIPTTAVHEAYPGHHWQLVQAKLHPSPVRRAFRTPYFSEGWGLYAEQVMREQGFFEDSRHELCHLEATHFRAARIVVDTSLHLGEMSHAEAVRYMMERANLTEPVARAEVTRYCAWPTQASSYLTGCLEIRRIRERFFDQRGSRDTSTLRAFHDRLGRSGGLPIALAERVALAD